MILRGLVAILLGIVAAMAASAMTAGDPRYALMGTVGLAGGVLLLCLGSPRRIMQALIAVMAITIQFGSRSDSVVFATTLFPRTRAPDQYVDHMVSVGGVEITVPIIAAAAVLILSVIVARDRGVLTGFAIKPLPASGFAAMFVAGVLSLVNAEDWALTGFDLFRGLVSFLLFTTFVANLDRGTVKVLLHAFAVLLILEGAVASLQFFFTASLTGTFLETTVYNELGSSSVARATGILTSPIGLAGILETYIPVILAQAIVEEQRATRLFYYAALLIGFAGLLAGLSRASWMVLPVPLTIVVLALAGKRLISLRGAVVAMIAVVLIGSTLLVVGPTIVLRFTTDDGGSAASRIPMALGALDLIDQYPVFGVGLNNYADALARHDREGWGRTFEHFNVIDHNLYLWTWAETGTIGLCALVWYMASALAQAAQGWRRASDQFERAIAVGVSMGLIATWLHAFVEIGFRSGSGPYVTATQIGLLAVLPFARARRSETERASATPNETPMRRIARVAARQPLSPTRARAR